MQEIEARFKKNIPAHIDFASLRFVEETTDILNLRKGNLEPIVESIDRGIMVTIFKNGGLGYAATADVSERGIQNAIHEATKWAEHTASKSLFSTKEMLTSMNTKPVGDYTTSVQNPWVDTPLSEKIAILHQADAKLNTDNRIQDRSVSLMSIRTQTHFWTSDGGAVHQNMEMLAPDMLVVVQDETTKEIQRRSFGLRGMSQQGGMEILDRVGFFQAPTKILSEALQLLQAPNCPEGEMDVLLMADQMMLQIHESIGHPLELDRILGDERNYAGTSFVTQDMFGSFQYGSPLLNVTFDPSIPNEFASYRFDDDGLEATKEYLIKEGVLIRPLGGSISQIRSGMNGVANSRACSWNRPPIDRMANLNIEPGEHSMTELISQVKRGVRMYTNNSWSIDDSRNKFQFGCEYGEYIEDGEIKYVVKNPNYRGISQSFWRNLKAVGDRSTFEVLGTPYCGKGEPNQVIRVGHASPACLFGNVHVFGGN